jgi:hypothetical protein
VELDMEYGHLAGARGVPAYIRVATVGTSPPFIAGLAEAVRAAPARPSVCAARGVRECPAETRRCAMASVAQVGQTA